MIFLRRATQSDRDAAWDRFRESMRFLFRTALPETIGIGVIICAGVFLACFGGK